MKILKYIIPIFVAISVNAQIGNEKNIENSKLNDTISKQSIIDAASNIIISPKSPIEKLEEQIKLFGQNSMLKNADWGFCLYNPQSKKIISSFNENTGLIPASTTKLLTTEAALAILKENFKWKTRLEYSGEIDSLGTLNGNLYIIGSGDPTLGTTKAGAKSRWEIIEGFKYSIIDLGIKKIKGNIIIQNALFKTQSSLAPSNIVWEEFESYYLPVGSTNDVNPQTESIINENGTNKKSFIYRSPYTKKMATSDTFTPVSELSVLVPMIPTSLANLLKSALSKSKIQQVGKVLSHLNVEDNMTSRIFISEYESPSLKDIVYYTNQNSDNFLAESLLKTVGYYNTGSYTLENGRTAVSEELSKQGFKFENFLLADGSGLSRNNTISAIDQVKFLTEMMNKSHFISYFESLPVAGQSGTLKSMFKESEANGNIFAKTGTLNKVKTLAGYIKTKKGEIFTFSLLVNNFVGSVKMLKQKMETLLNATIEL